LPLDIHDDNGIYFCDICPDKKFDSYEKIHKHYVKKHLDLDKLRGGNVNLNVNNFDNFYFENKLNMMKDELKKTIVELNREKNDEFENRKFEELKDEINKMPLSNIQNANSNVSNSNTTFRSNHKNSVQINNYYGTNI